VTDESGIASVTADSVVLTLVANDTWAGTITAAGAPGTYNVTVVATDASNGGTITAAGAPGTYNVTVVATDESPNGNNATDDLATYTVSEPEDTTPPEIVSVMLDPVVVAPNGSINVTVTATDESGIASVTADSVALTLVANRQRDR
jgi:hypothetical protein